MTDVTNGATPAHPPHGGVDPGKVQATVLHGGYGKFDWMFLDECGYPIRLGIGVLRFPAPVVPVVVGEVE